MIVVKIMGGLGNQLFQYAAGFAMAERLKTELMLDLSDFEQHKKRIFLLDRFELDATYREFHIDSLDRQCLKKKFLAWKLFEKRRPENFFYYREKVFGYDKHFHDLTGNIVLVGHWNSDKYFRASAERIREQLRLKPEVLAHVDAELLARIRRDRTVSVHVRRGDYVAEKNVAAVHGFLGIDYYRRSHEYFVDQLGRPDYFVFSDDPAWAAENLGFFEGAVFVDQQVPHADLVEFHLMSQCRHHVIANSSFSWWAAYLNAPAGKLVCAPQNWFADKGKSPRDIYVKGWQII